jgi:sugar lactone lactonase YvrE
VDPHGTITTVAGTGAQNYTGDGGPATAATFYNPNAIAFDAAGNMYISDWQNNVVRKVNTHGVITTFAGSGAYGYSGDGGPASQASLRWPTGLAVDKSGSVYISDSNNNVVRKVNNNGTISTFAGNTGTLYAGDGGPALSAQLNSPAGLLADSQGNLYICDYNHHAIRKVDSLGTIVTVAGKGTGNFSGDGGTAVTAELKYPQAITTDALGNLFIADTGNNRIRQVSPLGIISTVAGNTTAGGFAGDGGPAVLAALNSPSGVVADASGNLLIADSSNNRVREVVLESVSQPSTGSSGTQGQNPNPSGSTCKESQ